jgi:predicted enzyme related to lactoylglutathione lyase
VSYLILVQATDRGLRPGGATQEEDSMARVIHFEICANDPQRAVSFYQQAFGWKINEWEGPMEHWLIETGDQDEPGIDGAIMGRENNWTTVNTISVPSLDEFAQRVEQAGGKALSPRQTISGVGYHSYCLDTEGNVFGILEGDSSAG